MFKFVKITQMALNIIFRSYMFLYEKAITPQHFACIIAISYQIIMYRKAKNSVIKSYQLCFFQCALKFIK